MCDGAVWLEGGEVQLVGDASAVVSAYLDRVNAAEDARAGRSFGDVEHHGSGEIQITEVGLVDDAGAETQSLICGEPGTIRFAYRTTQPVKAPVQMCIRDRHKATRYGPRLPRGAAGRPGATQRWCRRERRTGRARWAASRLSLIHILYTDPYLNPNWADHRAQLIEPTNW